MDKLEVSIPIQTNGCNKNLRVFSKEAMEKAISDIKFEQYGEELVKMMSNNDVSLQPRAIGKFNDKNEYEDIKIISYDVVG